MNILAAFLLGVLFIVLTYAIETLELIENHAFWALYGIFYGFFVTFALFVIIEKGERRKK